MKTNAITFKEWKAFAVCEEIPKEPDYMAHKYFRHDPVAPQPIEGLYDADMEAYRSALQRVKDNAVEFENQDKAWDLIWRHDPDINSPISMWHYRNTLGHKHEGKIKTLTASVEVEFVEIPEYPTSYAPMKRVARIVEEPEEKCLASIFPNFEKLDTYKHTPTIATDHTVAVFKKDSEVEDQEEFLEKIEFIKGAFQCFVGYENHDGLKKFLKESKFSITRVNNPIK